jgi:hypothetical protein
MPKTFGSMHGASHAVVSGSWFTSARAFTRKSATSCSLSMRYTVPRPRFAAMEVELADSAKDHVEVTIKMPARLHEHLASICSRSDVKLDDIVCEQIERWLLRQTITRLEAPEDNKGGSSGDATEG